MKLIAGLGNPGREYRDTRHNVGFRVADEIARRHQLTWERAPSQTPDAFVAKRYGAESWMLLKPLTFMNQSGEAVAAVARYYDVANADLLVVVDDVDLRFGRLRARAYGSGGTHNGLKSVVERLGTREFPRLRLGVGRGDASRDWPTTCCRPSSPTNAPSSIRSSPGRPMPSRCLPRRASRR